MIKNKRKNKYLPLIILLGVLVVMIIAYSVLSSANKKAEAEEAARLAAENADIMIAEYDYSTMKELSYKPKDSDELQFVLSGTSWVYSGDGKFPLDQTKIMQMAAAISKIAVECTVDEGETADYGLDDPLYTIKVKYADGSAHTYKIGDYNTFNSSYYFMADGEIYMISSGLLSYFNYALDDLLLLDAVPYSDWTDIGYVNSIKINDGNTSREITGDEEKQAVIDVLKSFPLTNCADYYADDAEKSAYGLDGGAAIVVNYKKSKISKDENGNETTAYLDTSYSLSIGNQTESGDYYVSPSNSDIVYYVAPETVEALVNAGK